MQMLLVIFFIFNCIQNHKTLLSFTTFFIKPFFPKFLSAFPRCMVGRKIFVCTRETFLKTSHLHSSMAPCCIFVIYNISSTILEYLGAHLRFMLKCSCLSSSMTFSQSNLCIHLRSIHKALWSDSNVHSPSENLRIRSKIPSESST